MNLDTVLDWVRNFALAKMTSEDDVFVDDYIHNMFMDNDVYAMDVSTLSGMYETLYDLVGHKSHEKVSNIAGENIN